MALMDYCEMIIKLSAVYCYQENGENGIGYIDDELLKIAESIYRVGKRDIDWNELLSYKIAVPSTIKRALRDFQKYLYIRYDGDKANFRGVVSLFGTIRNKVVAHGILTKESALNVWAVMIWITMCLNHYLRVGDIRIDQIDGKCLVGYNDKLYEDESVISDKGYPCFASIAHGKDKDKYIFVNYYNGDKITPQYI